MTYNYQDLSTFLLRVLGEPTTATNQVNSVDDTDLRMDNALANSDFRTRIIWNKFN